MRAYSATAATFTTSLMFCSPRSMYPREMETIRRFLDEHPEVLYGGVGAAALVSGGALIYKVATR